MYIDTKLDIYVVTYIVGIFPTFFCKYNNQLYYIIVINYTNIIIILVYISHLKYWLVKVTVFFLHDTMR